MKLYTIGYEGTDIGRFIDVLVKAGVRTLADVRALPLSRKKGFSKSPLAARVERAGIRYLHFGDLGTPKAGRDAARAGRWDAFRNIFRRHMKTARAERVLAELGSAAEEGALCLMCFERDPAACHRSLIVAMMGTHWTVRHLYVEPSSLLPDAGIHSGRKKSKMAERPAGPRVRPRARSGPSVRDPANAASGAARR
jgi:uncharacterized protein (DUF488 family)